MSLFQIMQQTIMQASAVASQIASNVCATVDSLNLGQYLAPLSPVVSAAAKRAGPLLNKASEVVLPHISPYLDLAAPYIGGAKPHLDKVSQTELLIIVGGIFGGVFLLQLLLLLTSLCRRGSSGWKAFSPTVFWLCLCVMIHSWIEWTFVFRRSGNRSLIQNGMNLYGAADYRYGYGKNLELEPGTAAMEAITAFITGPLCLVLAWGIVGQKAWRWSVQVITCACQMYGLAWFMAHPYFSVERVSSEDPFLYWVIFVGFNAPWGIVPPLLLLQAVRRINAAVHHEQIETGLKRRAEKDAKARQIAAASAAAAAASPKKQQHK